MLKWCIFFFINLFSIKAQHCSSNLLYACVWLFGHSWLESEYSQFHGYCGFSTDLGKVEVMTLNGKFQNWNWILKTIDQGRNCYGSYIFCADNFTHRNKKCINLLGILMSLQSQPKLCRYFQSVVSVGNTAASLCTANSNVIMTPYTVAVDWRINIGPGRTTLGFFELFVFFHLRDVHVAGTDIMYYLSPYLLSRSQWRAASLNCCSLQCS